ncbi:helix-turn-helix domain-containing protein [Sporosarcina sp. FSL K6-5500]|uniref:helix-turn-helix domain-containing protein n=2 Tax=Sporosarcina TaxID=1569 RepID=UPI0030D47973
MELVQLRFFVLNPKKLPGVETNTMANTHKYTTWESLPDTLTAQHISQFLGISRRRVYELFQAHIEHGGIPNFEIGTSKRVEKSDFKNWITQKKEEKYNR